MSQRANALPYELQQKVIMAAVDSLRPFASAEDAETFISAPRRLRRQIFGQAQARIIGKKSLYVPIVDPMLESWVAFYEKFFPARLAASGGAEVLRALSLPARREGFTRLIVVLEGITITDAHNLCLSQFRCWPGRSGAFNRMVPNNDREPCTNYAIWVRDRVEADEEYRGLSAASAPAFFFPGITLLERMLLELKFFNETGSHLDLENATMCTGSRYANGRVPYAHWYDDYFRVAERSLEEASPTVGFREVSV